MSIKEQLIKESKELDSKVEIDSIFENVELPEDIKSKLATVFESVVKKDAVTLASKYINEMTEKADALVESTVETKTTEIESKLMESISSMIDYVAAEWLVENRLEVDRGIKANLFESMLVSLKTVFTEHNVVIPEDQIDIVEELEDELNETKTHSQQLFDQLKESNAELTKHKRDALVKESTRDLTELQADKVKSLTENLEFNDRFADTLATIVEMATKTKTEDKPMTEQKETEANLNFEPEKMTEQVELSTESPTIQSYINAL